MVKPNAATPQDKNNPISWGMLRKLETFVFAFLFLALPFFAFRVVDATTSSLSVKNTAAELVQDLIKWQQTAAEQGVSVRVTTRVGKDSKPFAYMIQRNDQTVEEVMLPPGVQIIGSVTFQGGVPKAPASFIISKGQRTAHVEVDAQGLIKSP